MLQAILLSLAITYLLEARRKARHEDDVDGTLSDPSIADEDLPDERTALLANGSQDQGKKRPIQGAHDGSRQESQRGLDLLYAATPPEHDSDRSQ